MTAVANGRLWSIIAINKLTAEDLFVCTPSARPSRKLCRMTPKTKKATGTLAEREQAIKVRVLRS